ncbi:hypothetical protein [Streptomyces sp. NPDC087859]
MRIRVGEPLDFGFTGAMAGIHAVDLVDAAFTADFTALRLICW